MSTSNVDIHCYYCGKPIQRGETSNWITCHNFHMKCATEYFTKPYTEVVSD